jgi:hypothetical protein
MAPKRPRPEDDLHGLLTDLGITPAALVLVKDHPEATKLAAQIVERLGVNQTALKRARLELHFFQVANGCRFFPPTLSLQRNEFRPHPHCQVMFSSPLFPLRALHGIMVCYGRLPRTCDAVPRGPPSTLTGGRKSLYRSFNPLGLFCPSIWFPHLLSLLGVSWTSRKPTCPRPR